MNDHHARRAARAADRKRFKTLQPFQPDGRPLIAELYAGRTQMPFGSRQAWRWDLTWQRIDDRERWTRWHVAGDFGYAHTKWGAWHAVRRAYGARTALFAARHDQLHGPEPEIPRGESETAQGPRRRR